MNKKIWSCFLIVLCMVMGSMSLVSAGRGGRGGGGHTRSFGGGGFHRGGPHVSFGIGVGYPVHPVGFYPWLEPWGIYAGIATAGLLAASDENLRRAVEKLGEVVKAQGEMIIRLDERLKALAKE